MAQLLVAAVVDVARLGYGTGAVCGCYALGYDDGAQICGDGNAAADDDPQHTLLDCVRSVEVPSCCPSILA